MPGVFHFQVTGANMKIKLIGLGQCGSFVVYDVIASIFGQTPSKEIRRIKQSHLKHSYQRFNTQMRSGGAEVRLNINDFCKNPKLPDMLHFYIIDGNRKNAIIDGLQGQEINKKLAPLRSLAKPLVLHRRNNGCHFGQVGEYVFRQEKTSKNNIYTQVKPNEKVEINALVFAAGGGSGSGGAPVLNEVLPNKDSILFNLMVLPPLYISDRRQSWNAGRCIMRLASVGKQTALLLFSNLSESLDDQYFMNQYIGQLVLRLTYFGYTGNISKVSTDIDKKDLQVFFSGKPAIVGMSSLNQAGASKEDIEEMVEQALGPRGKQGSYGLSVVLPDHLRKKQFEQITKVMILIGLPPNYHEKEDIVGIVKRKVTELLKPPLEKFDCPAFSYTSVDKIELTFFLRHNTYQSSYLLYYFLKDYLRWHNDEKTEYHYITKNIDDPLDKDFLDGVKKAITAEADNNSLAKDFSKYKIYKIKEFEKIEELQKEENTQEIK
jgi:cell division GTPase FtsZ